MKNCNTLFIGNRKVDTWPRLVLPAGSRMTPAQRSSHACYVISEEPHSEQTLDSCHYSEQTFESCHEVAVIKEKINRNIEETCQLTTEKSSFEHGQKNSAVTALQDFNSNRSRSHHNLNISSGYSLEKSNINNFSDQSKMFLSIPGQPERSSEEPQLSPVQLNSQVNQVRENITETCDNSHQSEWTRDNSEIKSGSLILIVQCYNHSNSGRVSASGLPSTTRTSCTVQRFPVLVKIYQKCERYAIVMRTRRHQMMPSLYIKLKKCSVVRSTTNPCHFVVMVGGHDGKSYRFEASSSQSADEWMQAFSRNVTPWYKNSFQYESLKDRFSEILSLSVKENDDPSLSPSPCAQNAKKTASRKVDKIPLRPMPSLSESSDEDTSL